MICLVVVSWLLLYMLNIYSILSTILIWLATGDWIYLHVLQKCKCLSILLQNCYFLINLMKKVGNFFASDYVTLVSPITDDISNRWWCWTMLSNHGATMCQTVDSNDDYWWFWTVFYPIMEANFIAFFLRQDFHWGWTMYVFTHIVCVCFSDRFTLLLLYILYFLCTCIFEFYFVLTEAWYESAGIHEPFDEV